MNITSYADSWLRLMQMGFEGNLAGQDLLNFEISIGAIIMILLVIIAGCIQLIAIERQRQHQAALRQSILGSQMISAGNFLGNWKTTNSPDGKAYENVYVGQSLYVCSRVRNHLTGHGNGDVYADVRNGKPVFVKIVPCPAQQMNALEKKLIKAFNATSSYNNTAGGSRRR